MVGRGVRTPGGASEGLAGSGARGSWTWAIHGWTVCQVSARGPGATIAGRTVRRLREANSSSGRGNRSPSNGTMAEAGRGLRGRADARLPDSPPSPAVPDQGSASASADEVGQGGGLQRKGTRPGGRPGNLPGNWRAPPPRWVQGDHPGRRWATLPTAHREGRNPTPTEPRQPPPGPGRTAPAPPPGAGLTCSRSSQCLDSSPGEEDGCRKAPAAAAPHSTASHTTTSGGSSATTRSHQG